MAVASLLALAAIASAGVVRRDEPKSRSRRDIALLRIHQDPLYDDHEAKEEFEALLRAYGYDASFDDDDDDVETDTKDAKKTGIEQNEQTNPIVNVTEMYMKNPCVSVQCSAGAMCVVKDLEKRITACECPKACPFEYAPVCSLMGVQYDSKCHLHLQACQRRRVIRIAYEAACIPKSQKCSSTELSQFPSRFLDWALMVRDEEYLGRAKVERNVAALPKITQKHVAQWIFTKFDANENQKLDRGEQLEIKLLIKSVEKCVAKFLVNCDVNKDHSISGKEWVGCLLPGAAMDKLYFNKLYDKFSAEKVATAEELKEMAPAKKEEEQEEENDEGEE